MLQNTSVLHSFFWQILHCVDIPVLFTCSSDNGHSHFFYFLPVRKHVAINICVQVFVWSCFRFPQVLCWAGNCRGTGDGLMISNWLTQWWRQAYPKVCSWQPGHPGLPMCKFQLKSWQVQSPRRANGSARVQRQEKTNPSSGRQAGRCSPLLTGESAAPCSSPGFSWLDGAHPHKGGQRVFPSLFTQMLISSKNTLTGTPSTTLDKYLGAPWPSQVDT